MVIQATSVASERVHAVNSMTLETLFRQSQPLTVVRLCFRRV